MFKTMIIAALMVFACGSTALAESGRAPAEPAGAAVRDDPRQGEPARGQQQPAANDADRANNKDDERPFFYAIDMATRMLG
jgi:hypothetical protein